MRHSKFIETTYLNIRHGRLFSLLFAATVGIAVLTNFSYAQAQTSYDAQTYPVRIAVVLPFKTLLSEGARSLEYYRGLLLAAEDAKKVGYNVQITSINEDSPDADITPTLERAAAQADVMLGFFYRRHVIEAGKYCEMTGRIAAFPMSTFIPVDLKNNRACIFTATTTRQFVEKYTKIAIGTFGKVNIVYAHGSTVLDNTETTDFIREMKNRGCKINNVSIDDTPATFDGKLTIKRPNIIVTDVNDPQTLSELFSNIKRISIIRPEYSISILGSSQWTSFCNTPNIFQSNDVYVPILSNPNIALPSIEALRLRYQTAFHCIPLQRTPSDLIDGYDFGMMLIYGMAHYNTSFMLYPSTAPYISNAYSFSNPDNGCWTNENVRLMHYAPDGLQYLLEYKNK